MTSIFCNISSTSTKLARLHGGHFVSRKLKQTIDSVPESFGADAKLQKSIGWVIVDSADSADSVRLNSADSVDSVDFAVRARLEPEGSPLVTKSRSGTEPIESDSVDGASHWCWIRLQHHDSPCPAFGRITFELVSIVIDSNDSKDFCYRASTSLKLLG